ncbi:MAG: CTP synthase [Parcubacteria group bacterium]|nr:CTP synthase [Parcubacteria group bacterium]
MDRKFIFVVGGVSSSLGKGTFAASLGTVLKSRGFKVSLQKLDPYLNVDPGTMNPYQHGEVFVTDDGAETDLDLGQYERFIDENLGKVNNLTTGQLYQGIIAKERTGDFLGSTIQIVPHITDAIKASIKGAAETQNAEILIVEVGGTIGDIEGMPFLEAVRQLRRELGHQNTYVSMLTLLPHLAATGELKTKPTQHAVKELRSYGVQPDMIGCRADFPIASELFKKIALFCDVAEDHVIDLPTVQSIYDIPVNLKRARVDDIVLSNLGLTPRKSDLAEWTAMVAKIHAKKEKLPIALVGKYVQLHDAYISVTEALKSAGIHHEVDIEVHWINSEDLEKGIVPLDALGEVSGIVVPIGFGARGTEGKIMAARFAREHKVPYLGLCFGLQLATIEFARNVVGLKGANSTEIDPNTPHPVVDIMEEQKKIATKGATMRLGAYAAVIRKGTKTYAAYQTERVYERHRHRYEVNNAYRDQFERAGLIASGVNPDLDLVEIIELRDHPWFIATQFHPEYRSRPNRPHPLFRDFVGAAIHYQKGAAMKEKTAAQQRIL